MWLGTSINILSTANQKEALQGTNLGFFLLDAPETTFQVIHSTDRLTQSGYFLPKIKILFFDFQKRVGEAFFNVILSE